MENQTAKKPFFKTNAFKCIIALLCVLLISGIFLTISYGFMEVSATERKQRAINKVYGESMEVTDVEFDAADGKFATATVSEAYLDANGDYLIKSKGNGGWAGSVTCWILIEVEDGNIQRVKKVIIESSDGETLLNNINYLDKFTTTDYTDGFEYTTGNGFVTSGASMSSGAIDNSVNAAVNFVNTVCLAKADPYADYKYRDYIDMENTVDGWTVNGGAITYAITTKTYSNIKAFEVNVTVSADKKIASFEIVTSGSVPNGDKTADYYTDLAQANVAAFEGKGLEYFTGILGDDLEYPGNNAGTEISTGATKSSYLCMCAAAFALANYDYVLTLAGGNS